MSHPPPRAAPTVRIDAERCSRCLLCARTCPQRLIEATGDGTPAPLTEQPASCIRCGHCVAVCPGGAVRLAPTAGDDFPPAPPAPDLRTVLGLLRSRRSIRLYEPREVPEEVVGQLLDAARYAPTGHNACHVGCVAVLTQEAVARLREDICAFYRRIFLFVRHPIGRFAVRLAAGSGRTEELAEALPSLEKAERRIAQGDDPLFHRAPAILLFHAPSQRETSESDCALAAGQVTLLAPCLGLGTCHIGYASAALKRLPRVARRVGVPGGRTAFAVLTLGHPAVTCTRLVPRPPFPAVWI